MSGLISWTETKTQKLGRVAEAEKLNFTGHKDQFLFNSKLSGTLHEARSVLAAKNIGGAKGKLADLDKSLMRRQKITKCADILKLVGLRSKSNRRRNSLVTQKTRKGFAKQKKER